MTSRRDDEDPQTKIIDLAARRKQLPRQTGLFVPVPLNCLEERRWDCLLPGRVRLYFYLLIKSRGGLKQLEELGAITVEWRGRGTPLVTRVRRLAIGA